MVLLAGDVFDGSPSAETVHSLHVALTEMAVPVFIAPGNHDFCCPDSPWLRFTWPENVHIFTRDKVDSVPVPDLDCRVYGAGFQSMDCPALLDSLQRTGSETHHIGIFHADPTQASSPYNPVTAAQVRSSSLDYLALGHIHKGGSFRAGSTLCAWPGCPIGRGYDECGEKGVLIAEIDAACRLRFIPLDLPGFHDIEIAAADSPRDALAAVLPSVPNRDHYRVSFTGPSTGIDIPTLKALFSQFPYLELRDRTFPLRDPWETLDEDNLEGAFFRQLRDTMEGQDEVIRRRIILAARISRQLLDDQEVLLP